MQRFAGDLWPLRADGLATWYAQKTRVAYKLGDWPVEVI